jgi:hypothetical protein
MVRDEACLRQGYNDQLRQGHQCSKTMLIGESQFHISTPLGIEPGYLMTGSKQVDHWNSGTVYECSEIVGSPQHQPEVTQRLGTKVRHFQFRPSPAHVLMHLSIKQF